MADCKKLMPIIKQWEGGYAGNIDGKTCTMKGVTLDTFRAHFGKGKTCNDLRKINDEQWYTIFKSTYWDDWKGDSIKNQSIANLLVDWHWVSGNGGIYLPLRIITCNSSTTSTRVTDEIINKINSYPDQKSLFTKLWNGRKKHFLELVQNPKKAKFKDGWLNRLNAFHYEN